MKVKRGLILSSVFLVALLSFLSIPDAFAYWRVDWEDNVTRKTFVPVFVIYDPPGANSYQKVTTSLGMSLTLSFKSKAGFIVYVAGGVSTTQSVTLTTGLTTSSSTDPRYVGVGGDGIFGKKLDLYWHIWGYTMITPYRSYDVITKAELRGMSDAGVAFYPRADLSTFEYKVAYVPNLRGTVGTWHWPSSGTFTLGPTLTFDHEMLHSWSTTATIEVGAQISIPYLGAVAQFEFSWSSSITGTFSYKTNVHINDPAKSLTFTINADSGSWGSITSTIQDYIFWFNEY